MSEPLIDSYPVVEETERALLGRGKLDTLIEAEGHGERVSIVVDVRHKVPREPEYAEVTDLETGVTRTLGHLATKRFNGGVTYLFTGTDEKTGEDTYHIAVIDRENREQELAFVQVSASQAPKVFRNALSYLSQTAGVL